MRVACLLIPSFVVTLEMQVNPRLADLAVIVHERHKVIDASPKARRVRRGSALRQAKAIYPNAVFVGANHALYRRAFEAMLDALESAAPLVEPADLGTAYVDIRGLQGHYQDEFALAGSLVEAVRSATGLLASVGIASNKFVAAVAASIITPGDAGIVPPSREQEFLRDKDVALLPIEPRVLQRLDMFAIHTLGDIAALSRPSVEAQFGSLGTRLWELTNGIDGEPLRPRQRQEILTEHLSFDAPVAATEALVIAGRQLVARLVRRLRARTARRMHIQLLSEGHIIWERFETFREPTGNEDRMILVLKTRLSMLALPQAIDTAVVSLIDIGKETAKQSRLFADVNPRTNQLVEAVRQLHARYGRPMVWRPAEVDPCSRHPEERMALLPYDA